MNREVALANARSRQLAYFKANAGVGSWFFFSFSKESRAGVESVQMRSKARAVLAPSARGSLEIHKESARARARALKRNQK